MVSVKRFFKQILLENEFSSYDIDHISDVKIDEEKNRIEFHIALLDGRTPTLYVKYEDFAKWAIENHGNYIDMFREFVAGFLSTSDSEPIQEIIDDNDDIIGDDDLPSNADNSMNGADNHWDTSTIAKHTIPLRGNSYFGTFGNGFVVW